MSTVVRNDLGGVAPTSPGSTLVSLVHISDLHVLNASSPARGEWVELLGDDPVFRPLLHMHRPYDALTHFAVDTHARSIRERPCSPHSGRSYDIVVSTGDNIDNGQRNELDAYLAVMAGGVAQLDAVGSAQDPSAEPSLRPWPFWSPDGAVADEWRALGYPVVDDFVRRASAPIDARGFGLPWTSVPGNHDLMRQGTALPNVATDEIAVRERKSLRRPTGFTPTDAAAAYVDNPELFSTGPSFAIAPDPLRRSIDREEWVRAHLAAGAAGYTPAHAAQAHSGGSIDTVVDLDDVRLILVDTNHPAGDYQGSIGIGQLDWLDERLAEVDREPGRVAILVSHHGVDTLVNDRGHLTDRRLAADLTDVVLRHPCAVAWLVGHRHINRIEKRDGPAGGLWEITTSSIIDWPSQVRSVDVIRHGDGTVEIACTMLDHGDVAGSLGCLHHELAHRFATTGIATRMAGRAIDGDVRLLLPNR